MDSTVSSGPSAVRKTAARAAVEGAVVALVGLALAKKIWPVNPSSMTIGVAAAWAASTVSVAWLLWARGREMKIFWWAFGGGMALRLVVLLGLAAWGYGRDGVAFEALLLSYVFALLALLLTLEFRHLRIT